MNEGSLRLEAVLSENWQAWIVLRHLLPARLQRALVHEVVREASRRKIAFADLFEEIHIDEPIWNESWMIRPRPSKDGYANFLQRWIRSIVWQNGEGGFGYGEEEQGGAFVSCAFLDALTRLSEADLGWGDGAVDELMGRFVDEHQSGLRCLLAAYEAAWREYKTVKPDNFWQDITTIVESVDMPLRAMIFKHVADLCADADAWKHARCGYVLVESLLQSWTAPDELRDVVTAWKAIVLQCQACARGIIEHRSEVANLFNEMLEDTKLEASPVVAVNAGLDAVNACQWLNPSDFKDRRTALLWSPLLHPSHDTSHALGNWLAGKHRDAGRRFWSVLRRQIALGAATELRATKAWYARSILDQIAEELHEQDNARLFEAAIRLLVEAEQAENVGRINWKQSLVDAYVVKQDLVDGLIVHAGAFEGAKLQRTKVLIELFKTWTIQITPSRAVLAQAMWRQLAKIAREFEATFEGRTDVARPALKALQELGKKRPELRGEVAADVAEAICNKLREQFPWGKIEAVEAAIPYVDAFDQVSLRRVVTGILDVLENEDPARDFWPLSRPALRFLVDREVRSRLHDDGQLNRRCLDQVLRFGIAYGSHGSMMVFFHLADFDPKLLEDEEIRSKLEGPLGHVRRGALQINASSVTDHIRALFVAPHIARYDGIHDAIEGLLLVLESARAPGRWSIGLPHVDGPLLVLTEELEEIRCVLMDRKDWLEERLAVVAERLATVWELAAETPLLFAPFALPPRTRPSDVLVHNCAFASLRFAQAIGREVRMREVLNKASENPALRGSISLARATNAMGTRFAQANLDDSSDEDRDSFYRTVGRRLTQLQRLPNDEAEGICRRLVEKCLRFGPHPADAAVLLAAASLDLHDHARASGLRVYAARVQADADNRLLLLPIVDLFWTKDMNEALE